MFLLGPVFDAHTHGLTQQEEGSSRVKPEGRRQRQREHRKDTFYTAEDRKLVSERRHSDRAGRVDKDGQKAGPDDDGGGGMPRADGGGGSGRTDPNRKAKPHKAEGSKGGGASGRTGPDRKAKPHKAESSNRKADRPHPR